MENYKHCKPDNIPQPRAFFCCLFDHDNIGVICEINFQVKLISNQDRCTSIFTLYMFISFTNINYN